jgi:hypothetical protein
MTRLMSSRRHRYSWEYHHGTNPYARHERKLATLDFMQYNRIWLWYKDDTEKNLGTTYHLKT